MQTSSLDYDVEKWNRFSEKIMIKKIEFHLDSIGTGPALADEPAGLLSPRRAGYFAREEPGYLENCFR